MKVVFVACAVALLVGGCSKERLSTAQYEARNTELMTAITAVFAADGKDCPKLAGAIERFLVERKADMEAVVAFESSHPKDRANYELNTGLRLQREFAERANPALEACANDQQFQDAWSRFTN